jgi:pimeloyl-ACP methyl ester carboxylesterase
MPLLTDGPSRLHYDVEGRDDAFPILVLAPGGMRSANALWKNAPWNPRSALADTYRIIGMDQRNAGDSYAPIRASDSWTSYAEDQLRVLDHLGIERCHYLGMCIGGPFGLKLLTMAPDRFSAAVLLQPAGVSNDPGPLRDMFADWTQNNSGAHPEASPDDFAGLGANLWGGDFALSVTRAEVQAITTPMLVTMGNDQYHPSELSREIASLAPNATLVERWKEPEHLAGTDATIKAFLAQHTPR